MCLIKENSDTKVDELKALLHHMNHHNTHHIEDLEKMKNTAQGLALFDVAEKLIIATELSQQVMEVLEEASRIAEEK